MNYIGPFIAFAAFLQLIALAPVPERMADFFRKLSLILAIFAPPLLLIFYYLFFRTESEFPLFYDIKTNLAAAIALYGQKGSAYDVYGAVSFPFPTFWLYWLATGFGHLDTAGQFVGFTLLATLAWVLALIVFWGELQHHWQTLKNPAQKQIFLFVVLAIPAGQTIGQGQTTTFVLLGVVLCWLSLRDSRPLVWLSGGIALALAIMIKPQLVLVMVGLLIAAWLIPDERKKVMWLIAGIATGEIGLLLLTLLLPGGVNGTDYERFFTDVLPDLAPPTTAFKPHGSPAFFISVMLNRAGVAGALTNPITSFLTLLLVGILAWRTVIQQRKYGLSLHEIFALWLIWAVFTPELSWNFYATWSLPAFVLFTMQVFTQEMDITVLDSTRGLIPWFGLWQKSRLAVIFLTLFLLNIQVAHSPVAVIGFLLMGYLAWTYRGYGLISDLNNPSAPESPPGK